MGVATMIRVDREAVLAAKAAEVAAAPPDAPVEPEVVKDPKVIGKILGCRIGTQAGNITGALRSSPKTVVEIAKETNLPKSRVKGHLGFHLGNPKTELGKVLIWTTEGFSIRV